MNAERLLQHYEQIADAPDAIARLRRFILDLAVRGKLVPQDSGDEPAMALSAKIRLERQRRIDLGSLRPAKRLEFGEEHAFRYAAPKGWCWVPANEVWEFENGDRSKNYPSRDHFVPSGVPFVNAGHLVAGRVSFDDMNYITEEKYSKLSGGKLRLGDQIYCLRGSLGKHAIYDCERPAAVASSLVILRPVLADLVPYLRVYLDSDVSLMMLRRFDNGTAQPNLSSANLRLFEIPLPPLAEQHRIVAKVDELMALCDGLEAARAERETKRDRLATASLARLNTPDPETFRDDVRFALDALPDLTARPDQIKQLRQTVLNLAVRGKLVPQDPADEPAGELLKHIAKEQASLVRERKAKRQEALPEIDHDQGPFELPDGWTWGRFPELGTFGRGKSKHRPRNDPALFDGGEHLMIQTGDVARSRGVIQTYTSKYNDFGLAQSFKWPKGTLCITIAANIADSGILGFDACFPDSVVGFIPASIFENARYFEYFVRTAKANLLEFAPATAQKNINLEILMQVLIPIPPLAEQLRIVAKVDELMALCDELETSLTSADETRKKLLDSLLAEALGPVDIEVLQEAAE